jgi:hypothetical protein
VGPRAVLDTEVKRKIPSPRRESNLRTQIVQPVAQRCTDLAITALPQSSTEVKNVWRYTSTVPRLFVARCVMKHRDKFTFTSVDLLQCHYD